MSKNKKKGPAPCYRCFFTSPEKAKVCRPESCRELDTYLEILELRIS